MIQWTRGCGWMKLGLLALVAAADVHAASVTPAELYYANGAALWYRTKSAPAVQQLKKREPTPAELKVIESTRAAQAQTAVAAAVLMVGDTVVYSWTQDDAARAYWGASIGKSVLSMAVGQAVCSGKLTLASRVRDHVPEVSRFPVADATVRDLLRMSGGTSDEAVNADSSVWSPQENRAINEGRLSFLQLAVQEKLLAPNRGIFTDTKPGERFSYKTTDPVLLGVVLRRATETAYGPWLQQTVFDPMGAEGGGWVEQDSSGYGRTSAGVRLSLSDWQRFALWVQRVSREPGCLGDYTREAMRLQIDNPGTPSSRRFGGLFDGYGYFYWVRNRIAPSTVFAVGYGGQRISWHENSQRMTLFFSREEDWMQRLYGLVRAWNEL